MLFTNIWISDALKALHIIPRSPSPVPLEERDVDSLSLEEIRELVRRQRVRSDSLMGLRITDIF